MINRIPQALIDELISRTNIVHIINQRIPLKKQGSNFIACCPFHVEKTPSFTVNLKKKFYYCFSCGSHGNIINFLMHHDQLTFIESIQQLSILHGISIKHFLYKTKNNNYHGDIIYTFMRDICNYYQNNLKHKKYSYAYKYLKNRGLTDSSIIDFKIGFAPMGWNNILTNINLSSYNHKLIHQSGMWIKYHQNKKYDRFRNRIMFPMHNKLGKIIAFGGRLIQNNNTEPKYLNSPDTYIFKKNQYLYGFYEICTKYKNIPYILLVEGYIDVIILTQFGVNYAVASLGTSITINHIQLIYSVTNQMICCYDGDSAGKKAAWRTLNIILPYLHDHREICFMFLPVKEDPDTLIRKIGKDNFLKQISKAQSLSNFIFDTLLHKVKIQTLEGRVKLSHLMLPMINKIPGQMLKLCLLQQLGNKIGILDENKLNQLLIQHSPTLTSNVQNNDITYNIKHILIGLLIQNPKLAKLVPTIKGLKECKDNIIIEFVKLVKLCKSYPYLTTEQLIHYYHQHDENNCFTNIIRLAHWNHMITDDMITVTFIDTLTKLYDLILEHRQNILISRDRTSTLKIEERQELWLLNQTLSKHTLT